MCALGFKGPATAPPAIYFWGAQLEVGAFPTSYIPTTTSTVTRSADVASITGSNFSSWYRQDEGTMFIENRRDRTTAFLPDWKSQTEHQTPGFFLFMMQQ
jgi:hypothetical protein